MNGRSLCLPQVDKTFVAGRLWRKGLR